MTRDEIIMSFVPVVDNIVKKYNNHESDEDLQSVGMIKCIKAVDRCLSEGVTDPEKMKPRIIVWAKNAILDTIYTNNNYKQCDDIDDYDFTDDSELEILKFDIRSSLKGKALQVFDMKLAKNTPEEICKALDIKSSQYYNYLNKIKNLITGKN